MSRLSKFLVIGSFSLLAPAAASAADLPPAYDFPPPMVEIGSNWYLRGDIGYKIYGGVTAQFNDPNYVAAGFQDMVGESLSNTGTVGIGVGYRFSSHFRVDATLDYEWPGHFRGFLPCLGACAGQFSTETADISAWTGLFNAYWDIATFGNLTPYVGAGIGASRLTTTNVAFINPDASTGTWTGASRWNLAWALMAGASWDLNHRWSVDFNYRFLHLGNAQSGIVTALAGTNPIEYKNIRAHEFRIGFRYNLH